MNSSPHQDALRPSGHRRRCTGLALGLLLLAVRLGGAGIFHAQGEITGEPSDHSVILQSRLTATPQLDADRTVPGARGVGRFRVREVRPGARVIVTPWLTAQPEHDFILRHHLQGLTPDTRYAYQLEFGTDPARLQRGPERHFRTLPGPASDASLSFLFFNCMGWGAFMDGYSNRPASADPDKDLGFPTMVEMQRYADAHFMIGGGDLVYYDIPATAIARTAPEMRAKWQQQFSTPRTVQLVGALAAFWMKDDHDFRYDDADLTGLKSPSPELGIQIFREQMPVVPPDDAARPTYRTVRATRDAQLWLLEGRDYRSPNRMEDGPAKSLWGPAQRAWLKETLRASDARWKIIVTPTPMVGPDGNRKRDNHTNPLGFRHEGEAFFAWMKDEGLKNVILLAGDRHWQYHSIHPSGYHEFGCGSLHREIAVGNPPRPGDPNSSDPEGRVVQRFVAPRQDGGFMRVTVGALSGLEVEMFDQAGIVQYKHEAMPE